MSLPLTGNEKVADVIRRYPYCKDIFVTRGFKKILNPIMLKTVATKVTLHMACDMKEVDEGAFLKELNETIAREEENDE